MQGTCTHACATLVGNHFLSEGNLRRGQWFQLGYCWTECHAPHGLPAAAARDHDIAAGSRSDGHSLITRCATCITKSLVPVVQDTWPFKVPLDNITRRNGVHCVHQRIARPAIVMHGFVGHVTLLPFQIFSGKTVRREPRLHSCTTWILERGATRL